MMKIVFALAFVAVCSAAVDVIPIVAYERAMPGDGTFHYKYETGDGVRAEQHGALKSVGNEAVGALQGSYAYTAPDGQKFEVSYIADENGYQPQGAHIPTIPEAIARSLEWNKAHPQAEQPLRKL